MSEIKFGTDGWRAILGTEFTPENVTKVIHAFCEFKQDDKNRLVYIGYDRREQSPEMAKLAAQILGSYNFEVRLAETFCPTPCVSWLVKSNKALAAVMITASHNPANWNGIKFKEIIWWGSVC